METELLQTDIRKIPSVEKILQTPEIEKLVASYKRSFIVQNVQYVLDEIRQDILSGCAVNLSLDMVAGRVFTRVEQAAVPSLRKVINATGIILHTGLGRAVLSKTAREALTTAAGNYCNLELDLQSGQRGSRQEHIQQVLCDLTGAEAAMVVNNNAAAVMLALNTLAYNKEVVVARGQLVEIGGSFRMPDIMESSESHLVEIGTTNRVTVADYRHAVTDNTGIFLKVHPSNYRIVGYTTEVSLSELVYLGDELHIPVMYDLGSGSSASIARFGLSTEPLISDAVRTSADIITFSADKMLGGPQAGVILGKKRYINLMKGNPLTRVTRVCKLTLAALEATVHDYLVNKDIFSVNPTLKCIAAPLDEIESAASSLSTELKASLAAASGDRLTDRLAVEVVDGYSMIGGGSFATDELPTKLVAVSSQEFSMDALAAKLRVGTPPVIGRIAGGRLLFDMRTVLPGQEKELAAAFRSVMQEWS